MPEAAGTELRAGRTPSQVLEALRPGIEAAASGRGGAFDPSRGDAEEEIHNRDLVRLEAIGARVLPLTDSAYPPCLSALVDAPPVLLVRGNISALAGPAVAIVGARAATRAGRSHARRLGRELAARGLVIVSGLARGIDAEAHRGALEAGGRSVGVLACGIDRIYPPEHRSLAEEVAVDGAVVSEVPLGTAPRPELFPLRNRIISGLGLGVIVVEARRRSGSLITVRHALNQGREVFVLPGAAEGPFAEGSNRLLREGARAISTAADVLEDLGIVSVADSTPRLDSETGAIGAGDAGKACFESDPSGRAAPGEARDPIAAKILAVLREGPASRDDLAVRVEVDPGKLARALLDLELTTQIVEERDGKFHLCWG